ncbi:MAG TPA: hypothetical protein VFD69_13745 [Vicinamibacterales bacterium]|nr:hypothetical protein [Vicinamibacterales bacterium]
MRLAALFFCLLAATACDESPTGPTVSIDARFTLAPGETASIEGRGVRLRFEGVTGDSRCPADAICIQGGDAVVKVQASGDGGSLSLDLHTGDASRASVTYGGVKVTLVDLQPYPFSSRTTAPGDYRATLVVSVS